MNPAYDLIIVGGGIMGTATAYHLLSFEPNLKLAVVEKDPLYTYASTPLSLGGIRVQFSLKENILISLYAQEAYGRFEEEMAVDEEKPFINYRQEGYLFFIEHSGRAAAEAALTLQKQMGGEVEWWSPEKIAGPIPDPVDRGFLRGDLRVRGRLSGPLCRSHGVSRQGEIAGGRIPPGRSLEILRSRDRIEGVLLKSGSELKAGERW